VDGMLVASTYPLIALNQAWIPTDDSESRTRIQFATSAAEGQFNAMLSLLNPERPSLLEYSVPFADDAGSPPVWISVVGNGGIWPVRVDAASPEPSAHILTRPRGRNGTGNAATPSVPWGVALAFFAATGWVLLRVFAFWSARLAASSSTSRVPTWLKE